MSLDFITVGICYSLSLSQIIFAIAYMYAFFRLFTMARTIFNYHYISTSGADPNLVRIKAELN